MSLQFQNLAIDSDLHSALVGKTLRGVRPSHDNGPVPDVHLSFTDGTTLTVSVQQGVYFEACLINTLRKSQPVAEVLIRAEGGGDHSVEIRSRTFPLIVLLAVNKEIPLEEDPFVFTWRELAHA